jgi:hypothetical protein
VIDRTVRGIVPLATALVLLASSLSVAGLSPAAEALFKKRLLFNIQGKGSSLAYDAGVFAEVFKTVPAVSKGEVILSANSGGSIVAGYFACHGISPASVARLKSILVDGTPRIKSSVEELRSTVELPIAKLNMMAAGKIPYIEVSNLDAYIESALDIDNISKLKQSPCKFEVPFVIAAGNYEIVHNIPPSFDFEKMQRGQVGGARETKAGLSISGRDEKVFSRKDFSVSWKTNAFQVVAQLFSQSFAAFSKERPDIAVGKSPYLGRACTYFASKEMYEVLAQIPSEQRLCDLRLTDDPESLALAIRASSAEPTYFYPVEDSNPAKLLVGDGPIGNLGLSKKRSYWGGFVMPMVAGDIRRRLPHLRVLGSGWARMSSGAVKVISTFVLVDSTEVSKATEYWADSEFVPSASYMDQLMSFTGARPNHATEYENGRARAEQCLTLEKQKKKPCLPENVLPPQWDGPVFPDATYPDDEPLERARGLGDLLS